MICRLTGSVVELGESAVVLDVGGVCYEVFVPAAALPELQSMVGRTIALHTLQYLEGSLGGANLTPRLIGFLTSAERAFFNELVRVKGVSTRKALRSMKVPVPMYAAAIARGDEKFLSSLPEIGKKTAAQMVAELAERVAPFMAASTPAAPAAPLSEAQELALQIIVQWGDRPADAQRWIAAAVEANPGLSNVDELVRAAYRAKQHAAR